jgi:hypothetical protein
MSSTGTYTPGPWRMEEFRKGSYLVTARNAGTAREGIVAQHVPGIANARLIAAAPELYEALENLIDFLFHGKKNCKAILRAKAALAKARGDEGEDNA